MKKEYNKPEPLWLKPIYKEGGDTDTYLQYKKWVAKQGKNGVHKVQNREYNEKLGKFNG